MKKCNVALIFALVFCRLIIQLDGAEFNVLENAKGLYHMSQGSRGIGNVSASCQEGKY